MATMISSGAMENVRKSLAEGLVQWSMNYLYFDREAAKTQDPTKETFSQSILLKVLPEKQRRALVHDGIELYRQLPLENERGHRREMMEAALREAAVILHTLHPSQPADVDIAEMHRFRNFRAEMLAEERGKKENPNLLAIDDLTPFQRLSIVERNRALKEATFQRPLPRGEMIPFPQERLVNCT